MVVVNSGETVRARAKNTQRSVRWFFEDKDVVVLEILIPGTARMVCKLGGETKPQESKDFLNSNDQ